MEMLSDLTFNPQIQMLVPLLLMIVPMLRSIPTLPKWTNQWIILFLAVLLALLQSGFNIHAIYNAFLASMSVTYVTRGIVNVKEEKELGELKKQYLALDTLINATDQLNHKE